ncbi:hypothetical protein LCGC14_0145670 [marine sediment metagenome]|uniref:HTH cro/C1-type domain-containing protein n=1 Tax=marine sediment metagenome TaxID=412755 RepID=A0A0F9XHA8_9ZZZZ
MDTLQNRLNQELDKMGMEPKEFAELVHIAPSTLKGYTSGRRLPSVEILIRMAEVLGCTLDWLVGYELRPETGPNLVSRVERIENKHLAGIYQRLTFLENKK